jgi:glucose-1-phosphate cytidylyltransferase
MKVVILCGGRGIRSFPFTNYLPKPMMPLLGTPIIVHVIKSFIAQGFRDFVLAAGYRKSVLDDYFEGKDLGARIQVVDTGEDTNTGGRILACRDLLGARFIATYADGLCDVPLDRLVAFHDAHDGVATITSVLMASQYGVLTVGDDGQVEQMREKPIIKEHWINAGFIVFDSAVFTHWHGEDLEREVLPHLIGRGMVYSYRHDGFFKSADNYKDIMEFEELMGDGRKPWDVRGFDQ